MFNSLGMFRENFKMAVESIKSNKMRTFLTMLGIIIGVSSVIMIVAAGDGAKKEMMKQFEGIGTNSVILSVNAKEATDSEYLTFEDMMAIKDKVPNVVGVSPVWNYYGEAVFRGNTMSAQISGGSDDILMFAQGMDIMTGRMFDESEYLSGKNVCLIDENMANKFFGNIDVTGMTIDVSIKKSKIKLRIVGVISSQFGDFYREGMPGQILLPITTLTTAIDDDDTKINSAYVMSDKKENTESVGNAVLNFMNARRSVKDREVYFAENMLRDIDMVNQMTGLIQNFVAAVAAISLLVGGIGVMNIMLVAVTERTREIGIRKSLGAKTNSILLQFLTESAILTVTGGIIGLIIGYAGGYAICTVAKIEPVFSPIMVGGTLVFSAAVGLFFGIYPARKAAKLNPIDALRHE